MKVFTTALLIFTFFIPITAQQSYVGSGLRLIERQGMAYPLVQAIVRNSPAARTNLRPGEPILAINGESTAGMSGALAESLITGPAGKQVALTAGETKRTVTLIIGEIKGYCVQGDCTNGAGIYAEIDGSRYEGQFRNSRFEGEGKIYFGEELHYAGQFRNGLRHGWGVETPPNSSRYEGEFSDDIRHGKGKLFQSNGTLLEGEWVEGRPEGEFSIAFPSGNRYQGHFQHGALHGYGVMVYANGHRYEGQWLDGAKTEGKYYWTDKEYYEGAFDANGRTGFGKYYYADGARYEGEWQRDEIQGQGKLFFPDGSVFEGSFSGGRGSGVLHLFEKNIDIRLEDAGIGEIMRRWGEGG